jgi:tellurium resistance protein TerD
VRLLGAAESNRNIETERFRMTVSLQKGGNVSLTKEAGGRLTKIAVGLGWQERATAGEDFDPDAMALVLKPDGRVISDQWFVFFNNLDAPGGVVHHTGDDRTGAAGTGGNDNEIIEVDLAQLPPEAEKVLFVVNIYEAVERGQNFGMMSGAYIRIVDANTTTELARFDLGEDASTEALLIFGEVYRHSGEWKFRAVEQGYPAGLADLAKHYGVTVN